MFIFVLYLCKCSICFHTHLARSVFATDQFALLICRLVSSVIRVMGDVFTELKEHETKITEIIKEEEASFCKTLAKVRAGFKFHQTFYWALLALCTEKF